MIKIYDSWGHEVDRGALKTEQAAPTIGGVRNIYSVSHPSVALTPERLYQILTQSEYGDPYWYLELAEEMEEKDLHYLAVLSTRKETVAQLDMVVRPVSKAADHVKAADLVRNAVRNVLGAEQLFDILDAVGKGFSATEIIWKTSEKEWMPTRLIWRDPRWFLFDWIGGEILLVRSLEGATSGETMGGGGGGSHFNGRGSRGWESGAWNRLGYQPLTAPLNPFQFIVHISKVKSGLPIRGGIARASGWAWLFKNFLLKDWLGFAEIYGQPYRIGKYHPGATQAEREELLRAVSNMGSDAAAVIPQSMMIELLASHAGRAGESIYSEFCTYLDNSISKAVLGQTLTTELPKAGGSRAAAQVHEAVRRDILASDAKRIARTLARDLVKPIVDLNLGTPDDGLYPILELAMPDQIDDKIRGDLIAQMVDRGFDVPQEYVREWLGIPAAAAGEPVLQPATKGGAAPSPSEPGEGNA